MKLLDKIKDLFMDEVDVDDELEIEEDEEVVKAAPKPKKEENVLPKVMRDTIDKEEKKEIKVKPEEFSRELAKEKEKESIIEEKKPEGKKFNFPIDFDLEVPSKNTPKNDIKTSDFLKKMDKEDDFVIKKSGHNINVLDLEMEKEKEPPKKVAELYSNKEMAIEKPRFKATPVISPVYGILDKNYTKEEVKERDEESSLKRPSKKVDFETVRKKAFGNLADEIKDNLMCEDCELYKQVKRISSLSEDDLLYDMTVEPEEEKDVTIEKAYDNYEAFGVAYEPKVERKLTYEEEITFEKKDEEEPKEEEKKDDVRLDDIINNSQKIDAAEINDHDEEDDVQVLSKPEVIYEDKVEEVSEEPVKEEEPEEVIPSRSKKDTKVDDDFFELIDSMYKERTDD